MMQHAKTIGILLISLLVIFAILDFINLSAWVLLPYSCVTGKNANLTSQLGNTFALGGGTQTTGS